MNAGELFIQLGIKGGEKTIGALTATKNSLGSVKDMSLEAKAGIFGVIYGLEQMASRALNTGAELTNMTTVFGLSGEALQKYQYAAQQVNVSNETVTASFKGLFAGLQQVSKGGAPEALAMLSKFTNYNVNLAQALSDSGKIDESLQYTMQALYKFAQNPEIGKVWKKNVLDAFRVGELAPALMSEKRVFDLNKLDRAPHLNTGELKQLAEVKAQISNIYTDFNLTLDKFLAKNSKALISDVQILSKGFLDLGTAIAGAAEKFKLLQTVAHTFEGIANSIKLVSELADRLGGKESVKGDILDQSGELIPGFSDSPIGKALSNFIDQIKNTVSPAEQQSQQLAFPLPALPSGSIAPSVKQGPMQSTVTTVNQTNVFQGKQDPREIARHTKNGTTQALSSMPKNKGG